MPIFSFIHLFFGSAPASCDCYFELLIVAIYCGVAQAASIVAPHGMDHIESSSPSVSSSSPRPPPPRRRLLVLLGLPIAAPRGLGRPHPLVVVTPVLFLDVVLLVVIALLLSSSGFFRPPRPRPPPWPRPPAASSSASHGPVTIHPPRPPLTTR